MLVSFKMSTKRMSLYRSYLNDPDVPVPKTTLWRYTKKACTEKPATGVWNIEFTEWLFVRDRTRTSTGYSSGTALNLPRQGTSEARIVLGLGSG